MDLIENLAMTSETRSGASKPRKRVPAEGVRRRWTVAELDEESVLADVGGHAPQLEGLEAGPSDELVVGGGELAEVLDEVVVDASVAWLLRRGDLRRGMLADRLVRWPVCLLAILRLSEESENMAEQRRRGGLTQY